VASGAGRMGENPHTIHPVPLHIHAKPRQGCVEGKREANEVLEQLQRASEKMVPMTHLDISFHFSTAIKDIIVQLFLLPSRISWLSFLIEV